jgi:hypothetical protein
MNTSTDANGYYIETTAGERPTDTWPTISLRRREARAQHCRSCLGAIAPKHVAFWGRGMGPYCAECWRAIAPLLVEPEAQR